MSKFLLGRFILAFFAVGAGPAFGLEAEVAYVLQVSGPWSLSREPSQSLHPGQGLRPGDTISLRHSPQSSDLLVILGEDNRILAQRRCAVDDCNAPVSIPQRLAEGDSLPARMLRSIMEIWSGEDGTRVAGMESREGSGVLYEGVIAVGGVETELLPVIGDLSSGVYTLVWEALAVERRPVAAAPPPVRIELGPGRPTAVRVPGVEPGLYLVQALRGADPGAAPVADAWVLAVRGCAQADAVARFDEAVAAAQAWAAEVSGGTVRRFLRARLLELASSLPDCPG